MILTLLSMGTIFMFLVRIIQILFINIVYLEILGQHCTIYLQHLDTQEQFIMLLMGIFTFLEEMDSITFGSMILQMMSL